MTLHQDRTSVSTARASARSETSRRSANAGSVSRSRAAAATSSLCSLIAYAISHAPYPFFFFSRNAFAQPGFTAWRARPTASASGSTVSVITEPEPI